MSTRPSLAAQPRTETGKGFNRRLRAAGRIPSVVYGDGVETLALSLEPKPAVELLNGPYGRNTIAELNVDGEAAPRLVIMKEYQVHPYKRRLQHVDFWQITEETSLLLDVPIGRTGKSSLEAAGGQLSFNRKFVKVRCLPAHVPTQVVIDVATIAFDAISLQIADIPMPEGCEAVYKHNFNVLRVKAAKIELAEGGEAEGEAEA